MKLSDISASAGNETQSSINETQDTGSNWNNLINIRAEDNACATVVPNGAFTCRFDFNIPTNAIIVGIQFDFHSCMQAANGGHHVKVRGGVSGDWSASQECDTGFNDACNLARDDSIGDSTDTWGIGLVPSDVNTVSRDNVWIEADSKGGGGGVTSYIDHLEMTVYYTVPETELIPEKITVQIAKGGTGYIRMNISDEALANLATFKSNLKKPIQVFDDAGIKTLGEFELTKLNIIGNNEIEYQGIEYLHKSLKCRANYNPVLMTGILDGVVENVIYDWDDFFNQSRFATLGIGENEHIAFKDANSNSCFFLANGDSAIVDENDDPFVPDTETLAVNRTHWTNPDSSYWDSVQGGDGWGQVEAGDEEENWGTILEYSVLVKTGTNPTIIEFNYGLTFNKMGFYAAAFENPLIQIYDDDGDVWETLATFSHTTYGSAATHFTGTASVSANITNYLNNDIPVSEHGFDQYVLKIRINAGSTVADDRDTLITNYYSRIKITYDASQAIELSEGFTQEHVPDSLALAMLSDGNFEFPWVAGITQGDEYIIGTNVKTAIDAAWQAHVLNDTLTLTFDAEATKALFTDKTYTSLGDMLNEAAKLAGYDVWQKHDGSWDTKASLTFESTDFIAGSALTEDDVVNINIPGAFRYSIDTNNLAAEIHIIGQTTDIVGSNSSAITPEYTTIEELVITNPKLNSTSDCTTEADALVVFKEKAIQAITLTVDMNKKDYSSLNIQKKIDVNLWSGVIQITNSGTEEYVIESITYQQEAGGHLYATLHIARREAAS